ncbi:MAG TPA: DUF885 family protein, partial [Candidatus Dormibacteraeota bacterium]|nr:DUF885 family protein [Candidatus Dormibacteraeota bacterium]
MKAAIWVCVVFVFAGCAGVSDKGPAPVSADDGAFERLADDFLSGYLAWRPQTGTSLGFHEFDGKLTDYSRGSLDAELARLKWFDERLSRMNAQRLGETTSHDYRLLRSAIQREIFSFEEMQIYSRNPMTYSSVLDVNIYIKRNFAPLPDRVQSVIRILNQSPAVFEAARSNLVETLPRPQIQTAIEEANGAVDFLSKDLVAALKDVKREGLMKEFRAANERA